MASDLNVLIYQASIAAFAYLAGSIPTGYIMGRMLKGIDIREYGSGNPGATNVFRVVGKWAGACTLLADAFKGYLPVQLALRPAPETMVFPCFTGLAAIAGHNWTVFLKFKGGKGVATSAGVFLALLPVPSLIALGMFLIGAGASRHVSVGSMVGAISLCVSSWFITDSVFLNFFATFCTALILILHRKNIERLIHKEEPKFSWKKSAS